MVAMVSAGAVALAILQLWWWAAFVLVGVIMGVFEVRRLSRKKAKIEQRLEPPRFVG
jgi:F0F1-type ATP synthase assembly protein I